MKSSQAPQNRLSILIPLKWDKKFGVNEDFLSREDWIKKSIYHDLNIEMEFIYSKLVNKELEPDSTLATVTEDGLSSIDHSPESIINTELDINQVKSLVLGFYQGENDKVPTWDWSLVVNLDPKLLEEKNFQWKLTVLGLWLGIILRQERIFFVYRKDDKVQNCFGPKYAPPSERSDELPWLWYVTNNFEDLSKNLLNKEEYLDNDNWFTPLGTTLRIDLSRPLKSDKKENHKQLTHDVINIANIVYDALDIEPGAKGGTLVNIKKSLDENESWEQITLLMCFSEDQVSPNLIKKIKPRLNKEKFKKIIIEISTNWPFE